MQKPDAREGVLDKSDIGGTFHEIGQIFGADDSSQVEKMG
jgi:hypothetical protein